MFDYQGSNSFAGFWRRTAAFTSDLFILFIITKLINAVLLTFIDSSYIDVVFTLTFAFLYFFLQESLCDNASIGKKALKCTVVNLKGDSISHVQNITRILIVFFPLALFYIAVFFTDFHDMLNAGQHLDEKAMEELASEFAKSEEGARFWTFMVYHYGVMFLALVSLWIPIAFTKEKQGLHDNFSFTRVTLFNVSDDTNKPPSNDEIVDKKEQEENEQEIKPLNFFISLIKNYIAWVCGLYLLMLSVGSYIDPQDQETFAKSFYPAVLLLLSSIFCMPLTFKMFVKYIKKNIPPLIRFMMVVILFVVAIYLSRVL